MSLVLEILEGLWDVTANYKGMRVNILGVPRPWKYKDQTIRSTMSRLHNRGFIKNTSGQWSITKSGKKYLITEKKKLLSKFNSPFNKNSPKNLIVMFDIPELKKVQRNWFRLHLIKFGYIMIQKSVWVGPSPLPRKFVSYVKEIGLQSCLRSFKLAKPYKQGVRSY